MAFETPVAPQAALSQGALRLPGRSNCALLASQGLIRGGSQAGRGRRIHGSSGHVFVLHTGKRQHPCEGATWGRVLGAAPDQSRLQMRLSISPPPLRMEFALQGGLDPLALGDRESALFRAALDSYRAALARHAPALKKLLSTVFIAQMAQARRGDPERPSTDGSHLLST